MNEDVTERRLKDVEDNIKQDFDVLKRYEDELRSETDPRKMAKYEREIKRQRESLTRNQQEYDKWKKQAAPTQIQNLADLLLQKETKLDAFQKLLNQKLLPQISTYSKYRQKLDDKFKMFGDDVIKLTADSFRDLSKDQLNFELQNIREYGIHIMNQAKEGDELWATSIIYSPLWWQGRPGDNYILEKLDVAKRATVKQIFITANKKSLKDDEAIIKKLTGGKDNSKVPDVYVIAEYKIPKDRQIDFLILRNKIAFELILIEKSWIQGFNIYFKGSQRFRELEDIYDDLLKNSDIIKYDSKIYPEFDRFIEEVFK